MELHRALGNRPLAALLQHADFLDQMHKVLDLRNRWAVLAGEPLSEQTAIRQDIVQAGIKQTGGFDGNIGLPDPVPPRAAGRAGRQRTSAGLLAAVSAPL